ncbi:MAG: cobalamin-binding protein [Chloroflexi bacterium]|nr:cobalamin-binding protein [Chloroflexota bacterium]
MLDALADTDLTAIECLEAPPGGNVDLAELKAKWGRRFVLKGNVRTIETLLEGTPEMVEEEVRQCIRIAGPGGGFILSTGDQVSSLTPEENIRAYVAAGRQYGRYPLRLK